MVRKRINQIRPFPLVDNYEVKLFYEMRMVKTAPTILMYLDRETGVLIIHWSIVSIPLELPILAFSDKSESEFFFGLEHRQINSVVLVQGRFYAGIPGSCPSYHLVSSLPIHKNM
jgi:hypothetical protein